jgi:hypothetical protein
MRISAAARSSTVLIVRLSPAKETPSTGSPRHTPLPTRTEALVAQQHQALRWTYIGSGLVHERFVSTLNDISPNAAKRLAEVAPVFA